MSTVDTFTSSGTWTCPAYVTTVWVRCWGGGGSGGGITVLPSPTSLSGGGGAGGAYAETLAYGVTPGTVYTVTVGAVKTGSTGNGGVGNDTWFDTTSGPLAKGGAGGTSPVAAGGSGIGGGGSTTGCNGDNLFAGGSGGTGLANSTSLTGPGGGGAGSSAAGSPGSGTSGGGGGSSSGGSGGNGRTTAGAGAAGSNYGGGGSGAFGTTASHSFSGGNGAPGRMELEYTPTFTPAGGGIRAAIDYPINPYFAPATLDSLTPVSGDCFLLTDQGGDPNSSDRDNGLWSWASAGTAMSPVTSDVDGSYRDVREGTHAGARVYFSTLAFIPNSNGSLTIPTGNVYFVGPGALGQVIAGQPGPEGFVGVSPAVTSGGTWTVSHNLGTKFLIVQIAATASPYAYITSWAIQRTDLNTLSVIVGATIAAGDYEIMVRSVL